MFKNIIIVILVLMLCSLFGHNKKNVDILVEDMSDVKNGVVDGTIYLKNTFGEYFADKDELTIPFPDHLGEGSGIKEDTFFNEEETI